MTGNGNAPKQQLAQSDADAVDAGLAGAAISGEALRKAETYIEAEEGATNRLIGFAGRVHHRDRGRDVAVPSLHRDRRRAAAVQRIPDRRDAAAALHPRRLRAGAVLPAVSAVEALPQPDPVVRRRPRRDRGRDPDLRPRRRRGLHRPRDHSDPDRRHHRRRVHRHPSGGDAAHHRLDRSRRWRSCSWSMRWRGRICRRRGITAATASISSSVICSSRSKASSGSRSTSRRR